MASVETTSQLKRERDETQSSELGENKKHKPYSHILSILDDEEEPTQDISSLFTTLQQEIFSESESTGAQILAPSPTCPEEKNPSMVPTNLEDSSSSSSSISSVNEEEEEKERVMRRLLEASDDELGIPATDAVRIDDGDGDGFVVCDGLWELEDEAANYYTLLQSELFM